MDVSQNVRRWLEPVIQDVLDDVEVTEVTVLTSTGVAYSGILYDYDAGEYAIVVDTGKHMVRIFLNHVVAIVTPA